MSLVFFLFTASIFLFAATDKVLAASLTWDGGGVDNNWSTCANWTTDACPVAGDTVTFNGTSTKDSTVDTGFGGVVTSVSISSGYTGTVTLARSLQTTSTFTQAAGTFTADGQTLDVDGAFSLTAGTFNASSATMTFAAAFTISGSSVFNANGGTVTFDGTSGTLTCNNAVFNLVILNNTGTKTVSSNCNLPLGNNPTIGNGGGVTLNGTLSGSGILTQTAGTLTLNAGANLSGFSGFAFRALTISGATLNLSTASPVSISAAFILSSGTFTAPAGTMTASSTFTISGGTFNHNNGTITFDGSTATISCNNATFNLVTFNNTSTKTVSSNCSLPLGNNPAATSSITLNGTLSGSGTLTYNTLTLNAGATLSGFTGLMASAGTLIVSGATISFSSYTLFDLVAFTLSSGSFTAPAGVMTVSGTFTISGGTFNANGGTLTFDGGSSNTLTCGGATFNLVTFANTTGTKTVSADCSLPLGANPTVGPAGATTPQITLNGTLTGSGTLKINGNGGGGGLRVNSTGVLSGFDGLIVDSLNIAGGTVNLASYNPVDINSTFTLSSGTFTAPTGTMTVAGSFTISGGTFDANGGTITFDGLSGTVSCNNAVFNLVTFNHSGTGANKTISSDCSLPLGSNPTSANGGLILNGTLSGTGTLTVAPTISGLALTINATGLLSGFDGLHVRNLSINGATVNLGSYTTVDLDATLTLSSGATLIAPAGTMTVGGNLTVNTGTTFNPNGGTVTFDASSTQTITHNTTFHNLTSNSSTGTLIFAVGTTQTITGSITLMGTSIVNGTIVGSGTLTHTVGTLTLGPESSLSGFSGLTAANLTIDGATADFGSYNTLDINGDLTLFKPAVFTATSANMTVAGNFNVGSNEGHLRLPGISGNYASAPDSAALSVTGDIDLRVRVAMDSWKPSANQVLIEKYASPNDRAYQIFLRPDGTLQFSGSTTGTTNNYVAISTAAISAANGSTLWVRVTRDATTGEVTFYTSADGSTWSQLGSVVSQPAGGIFDNSEILQIGSDSSGTTSNASGKFYQAQVRNNILDDGTGIVFDADFTNHADGTTSFNESSANAATVTINGSDAQIVATGGGTFNHNNGTVILDGGNQTIVGGLTFNNLNKTAATAATLTLPAGGTETILGVLTFKGTVGQLLSLVSSSPGTQWHIDSQGGRDISYLAVRDSRNLNASTMVVCNSTDNGNNSGWSFNPSSCNPTVPPSNTTDTSSGSRANATASTTATAESTESTEEETAAPPTSQPSSPPAKVATETAGVSSKWPWWLAGLAILFVIIFLITKRRRRHPPTQGPSTIPPTTPLNNPSPPTILPPDNSTIGQITPPSVTGATYYPYPSQDVRPPGISMRDSKGRLGL